MNDFNKDVKETLSRYISTVTEVNERNKARVFDALAEAGITAVTVTFDGHSDSGQIDEVIAYQGETEAELPTTPLTLEYVHCYSDKVTSDASPLKQAVEDICYGYLAQRHIGWENNDGAFGTFELDVRKRTVDLEYNGRFSDYSTTTSSF
jgi:hypothetical protein